MASPISVELPLKIATWARRAAAGPQTIAPVIGPGIGGEPRAIAELAPRTCIELTGGLTAITDLARAVRAELGGGR